MRLQARGLLGKPEQPVPMDQALVALVGTCLRATDSLAVGLRRRSGESAAISLSFHRLGDMTVEHIAAPADEHGSEVHSLTALVDGDAVVNRVVQLVVQPPDGRDLDLGSISVETLERVRAAVAAGADEALVALAPELAHAFKEADIFGQLIRIHDGEPAASLTVLSRPGEVWSFLQPTPEDSEVTVRRVSPTALRSQIANLWS